MIKKRRIVLWNEQKKKINRKNEKENETIENV